MKLDAVARALEAAGITYALIGAVALAARGVARSTLDIDFLTTDGRVLKEDFWSDLSKELSVEIRRGDFEDPLAGVVRISGTDPIDIIVAKHKWLAAGPRKSLIDEVNSALDGLPEEMHSRWVSVRDAVR